MCGRYALTKTELLEEFFEFSFTGHQIIPRFNIAPTTQIPVIREDGRRELIDMRWGLVPVWSKPGDKLPVMINARAETVSSKPAFRDGLDVGAASCLPADITSGRNFLVAQNKPFTSPDAMGNP
jgi:putative SOS response-associated peptidase YedK